ncbi:MAG: transcriptional regulator [Candidatus Thorarchaeota archaeon]|nr:transcriptional regulator [Candidatus Thorarchaeota archaeon]
MRRLWTLTKSNESSSDPEINRVIHEPSRLKIVAQLYVVESADYAFLMKQLGLTWGNLSSHLSKLEEAGYIAIEKEFVDKKPRTTLSLTKEGRTAFQVYRRTIRSVLEDVPE